MKYSFRIPQKPDTVFDIESSFWTGKKTVWVNGKPCEESAQSKRHKPQFIIPGPEGTIETLEIKPSYFFDSGLTVLLNGTAIPVIPPLKWYEYIMGGFPILLIFGGGAIGALFGAIGATYNFQIIRSKMNIALKILAILGVSAMSAILYLSFVLLFRYLMA